MFNDYFQPYPCVIDFTSKGDDILNDMNFKRLYIAILTGKSVEIFNEDPGFGRWTKSPIARISRFGCILPSRSGVSYYKFVLDKTIKEFFASTRTPRYLAEKDDFFLIPGMEKNVFFDFYLRAETYERKFSILKKYLNFKKIKEDTGDNEDLDDFLKLYDNGKGKAEEVVEMFEEIFLEYYRPPGRGTYTEYGTVDFMLKEDVIEIWNGETYRKPIFKNEYLLYYDFQFQS